jgi:UDP-glucose 4-epimerase
MNAPSLKDKRILVTGGTGSFGSTMVNRLIEEDHFGEIIIFSRDEKKQHDMRLRLNDPRVRFVIGDVRDPVSLNRAMRKVDFVFHAAALKNVPSCEFFPYEAFSTNVTGTQNVIDAAENNGVLKVVGLSTDKAVYPINSMGISKAMLEKLILARARDGRSETEFCVVRYGNVMYSRGSVIPLFVDQIKAKRPLTITHPKMTRFLLPLPVAIDLVLFALEKGQSGDILVRKAPASDVETLAKATLELFDAKNEIKVIGVRAGEKLHETLINWEESANSEDLGDYYRVRSARSENYDDYFTHGSKDKRLEGYTSENTKQLSILETKELLLSLGEIRNALRS